MSTTPPVGPPSRGRASAPRSLADALRAMPDDDLVTLLRDRPDLALPLPPDLTSLATRAASRASVQRALDHLDTPALQVIEILAALPEPVTPGEVGRRWGAPATAILDHLRRLALVWGNRRTLRLVRTARELLGPYPAGLGPPLGEALDRRSPARLADLATDLGLDPGGDPAATRDRIAAHLGDPAVVDGLLRQAPDGVRPVLERLTWGPPVGQIDRADRVVRVADATGPVDWLLARGMLAMSDPGHVVLPRELGLALREGRVHRPGDRTPPALTGTPRSARVVTGTGATAALDAVRLVHELIELWGRTPAPVLRTGGLGVRELRRAAVSLDVPEPIAARVLELAYVTGLIADDGELDPRWAPTPAADLWQAKDTAERWTDLATAWLATTRCPALVGTRDARETLRSALGPDLDRAPAVTVRRWALDHLARATDRAGEPVAVDVELLRALLDWTTPRQTGRGRDALVAWALDEAAWLGLTGAGALTDHGRAVLTHPADASDLLAKALPEPVDHVLLQADLTAVAPGPLQPDLARLLALAAEVESRGGATVYRFDQASVRRALDVGLTGEDLLNTLAQRSRTGVPQPLEYLIRDTARRHGRVRVGAAGSYLRADDESTVAEVLADRRAAGLQLRRLAPTVLAAQADPATVLGVLRAMGLAPAAETADGDILLRPAELRRTAPRTPPRPVTGRPEAPSPSAVVSAVATLRAVDSASAGGSGRGSDRTPERDRPTGAPALAPMDPPAVLAMVREAAVTRRPVWLGYVDATGRPTRRLVDPVSVEAGRISAFDWDSRELRSFPVHRVTAVAPAT